jgi:hypothetical protein
VAILQAHLNEQVESHAILLGQRVAERTVELSESNAKLQESMDAIVVVDEAQHVLIFNDAAERVFRCRPSEVFPQSASAGGRETVHAGDQAHFLHESGELLGFYEINYADGLVATHEIRYDETVTKWNSGLSENHYLARSVVSGNLPDGRKAELWATEWINPRPGVPIVSVTLVGSPGNSPAQLILFGITAVEKPRVEDCR